MAGFTVGTIAQVLSLSGVVSLRMFLPVFIYFLLLRLAVVFPSHAPALLVEMASRVPAWQISWVFLTVMGVLAALELAAMRNPDIKQFLTEEVDRYAKPAMAILLACSVVNTAQANEIRELLQGTHELHKAGIGGFGLVMAVSACCLTATLCHLRSVILEKIDALDPDNSLRLQSIANYTGEITLVLMIFLLVVLPTAALFLTLCGLFLGIIFKKAVVRFEKKRTHLCPGCAEKNVTTNVSNCAVICPVCGVEQPNVCRVGWFGLTSFRPLGEQSLLNHSARLLGVRRCRWCAEVLKDSMTCHVCGKKQWKDEALLRFYLKQCDIRGMILLIISLATFFFPVAGCTLVLIFFRPLVLRPIAIHLSAASRFWMTFVTLFFKLCAAVILICLALIPGIGLIFILPFFMRYLLARRKFCAAVRKS